jgi:hypothetical protein
VTVGVGAKVPQIKAAPATREVQRRPCAHGLRCFA